MFRIVGLIAASALPLAAPAVAQHSPVSVNVGAGFTIPNNELKDSFGTGGNFQFGVNFRVTPLLKLQADTATTGSPARISRQAGRRPCRKASSRRSSWTRTTRCTTATSTS